MRRTGTALLLAAPALVYLSLALSAASASQDLQSLLLRAERGDAQAQFNLGRAYDDGDGVKQDLREALRWYQKAAEQGLAVAKVRLGAMYYNGDGVSRDPVEGVRLWREAAAAGSNLARFNLGNACYQGVGVQLDYVQAYMWMELAATHAARERDLPLSLLAARGRATVAAKLTAEQIAEAQRLAREWKPK